MEREDCREKGNSRFGSYLKALRTDRRLTLERIEEVSRRFGEPLSKTYLSRCEHGLTNPTLPRLEVLARVYKVRFGELAERFEMEREVARDAGNAAEGDADSPGGPGDPGEPAGALVLLDATRRAIAEPDRIKAARARLCVAVASSGVGNFRLCKEEAEALFCTEELPEEIRLKAAVQLALAWQKLRRGVLARLVVESLLSRDESLPSRLRADSHYLMGRLDLDAERQRPALMHLRKAVSLYRSEESPSDLARALLDLGEVYRMGRQPLDAMARYQEGLEIARRSDLRLLMADLLSHLGRGHRLLGHRTVAQRLFHESNDLARRADQFEVLFRNHYHLRAMAMETGDEFSRRASERALTLLNSRCQPLLEEAIAWRGEAASRVAAASQVAPEAKVQAAARAGVAVAAAPVALPGLSVPFVPGRGAATSLRAAEQPPPAWVASAPDPGRKAGAEVRRRIVRARAEA